MIITGHTSSKIGGRIVKIVYLGTEVLERGYICIYNLITFSKKIIEVDSFWRALFRVDVFALHTSTREGRKRTRNTPKRTKGSRRPMSQPPHHLCLAQRPLVITSTYCCNLCWRECTGRYSIQCIHVVECMMWEATLIIGIFQYFVTNSEDPDFMECRSALFIHFRVLIRGVSSFSGPN